MSRGGSLRWEEGQFAEYAARRTRWQSGSAVVDTDQAQGTQTVRGGAHNPASAGSTPAPASIYRSGADQRPARDSPLTTVSASGASLPPPLEKDIQAAILELLETHPRVAWAERMNTGGMERENADGTKRYIRFAFEGCSDIIGQLKDGRFLAVEVKRPGRYPTHAQRAFLAMVNAHKGVGIIAFSVDDVVRSLAVL